MNFLSKSNLVGILSLCFSLSACIDENGSQPTNTNTQQPGVISTAGGADTGGGNVDQSTAQQIIRSIEETRNFITANQFRNRFINSFQTQMFKDRELYIEVFELVSDIDNPSNVGFEEYTQESLDIIKELNQHEIFSKEWEILDEELNQLDKQRKLFTAGRPKSAKEYIPAIPLEFKEDGPCPAADNPEADASVSEHTLDATICFSISNLKRLPPSALDQHIFGLWMHELGHMMGEDDPVLIEELENVATQSYPRMISADQSKVGQLVHSTLFYMHGDALNLENNMGHATREIKLGYYEINSSRIQNYYVMSMKSLGVLVSLVRQLEELYSVDAPSPFLLNSVEDERRVAMMTEVRGLKTVLWNLSQMSAAELFSEENLQEIENLPATFDTWRDQVNEIENLGWQEL